MHRYIMMKYDIVVLYCSYFQFPLQSVKTFEKEINISQKLNHESRLQSSGQFSFPQSERNSLPDKKITTLDNQTITARDFSFDEECISSSLRFLNDTEKYQINPNCPGVVLIINEQHFYTEVDEKYKVS